jgi:hypothetical protein
MMDLDRINKLDKVTDAQKIGKIVEEAYHGEYTYLEQLSVQWEQNIRFYEGDQYIYYNQTIKNYEPIPITKYNDFIPRPVTNLLLPIEQTMTSILTKNQPSASVVSNTEDELDMAAAKVADRVVDAKWEDDEETLKHISAAKILQLCGTVFREDCWDPTLGEHESIPLPGGEEMSGPQGDNKVSMWTPFEIIPDKDDEAYFIKATYEPLWWVRSSFGKKGEGYTGLADKVKEDRDFTSFLNIRYRLKNSAGAFGRGSSSGDEVRGHVVLVQAYIKPTDTHPNGLHVVFANGRTLYCWDSPYYSPIMKDSWHPFTWTFWEKDPFRWHGLSLFENLVPLQKRINSIDSLIILNRMLNVSPQWLIPTGSNIPENYINGSPNLQIPYNPVGANGIAPTRVGGTNLASDVYKERQDLITQMHMIAGDNEVMQGQRPDGVNTLGGLNLLLEQSYSKFSPLIQGWEKFIEKGQQKKLLLIARKYQGNREKFTQKLKSMNRDNLDVEISQFTGAQLRDNIDIRIEAGSSLPRSNVVYQDQLLKLYDRGLLGDVSPQGNPIANQELLEEFGVKRFDSVLNPDVKRGRFIITTLKAINEGRLGPEAWPKQYPFDDLMLQKKMIEDAMKTPGFQDKQGAFQQKYNEVMGELSRLYPPQAPPPMEGQPPEGMPPGMPPPQPMAGAQPPPMQ